MVKIEQHNIQLVSLHIPKTAGTSFRNILKDVYGKNRIVRFDVNHQGNITLDEKPFNKARLSNKIEVIHGHFYFQDIQKTIDIRDIPLITWLRNPIDRVISNYYYLESVLIDVLNEEKRAINIRSKLQKTLIEYARAEINRNRISKFLKGSTPGDFAFIGLQEYFNDDLLRLSGLLKWKGSFEGYKHNATPGKKEIVEPETRQEIEDLNRDDMEWYNMILQSRQSNGNIS
jgi:sulfotransferase famil protein